MYICIKIGCLKCINNKKEIYIQYNDVYVLNMYI